ncbi:MAG: hypothetical protein WBA51_16975 [Erythrobacter sp.]
MQIILRAAAAMAICGMVVAAPVEPVAAQKFRGAGKVKTPKKPSNFRQAKAVTRGFKQRGKVAYNNLKATYRSEGRNRQVMQQARNTFLQAQDAWRANRSSANQNAMNQAYSNYRTRKVQHDNSLNAWRSAKNEVRALAEIKRSALNNARVQSRNSAQPRPPRRGQPAINPQRRVASQRQGASMVQSPRQIFQPGSAMAVRSPQSSMVQRGINLANQLPSPPSGPVGGNPVLPRNPYTPASDSIFRSDGYTRPPPPSQAPQVFNTTRILQNGYDRVPNQ